jgi:hypothetical protein
LGIYTFFTSNWVDSEIASRVQLITGIILKNINYVRSILLTGGFGKGEGSIKITNRKVICLRDFDMVVIVDHLPNKKDVKKLYNEIYQSLNLPNPEGMLYPFFNFVVDIKFHSLEQRRYTAIKWSPHSFRKSLWFIGSFRFARSRGTL